MFLDIFTSENLLSSIENSNHAKSIKTEEDFSSIFLTFPFCRFLFTFVSKSFFLAGGEKRKKYLVNYWKFLVKTEKIETRTSFKLKKENSTVSTRSLWNQKVGLHESFFLNSCQINEFSGNISYLKTILQLNSAQFKLSHSLSSVAVTLLKNVFVDFFVRSLFFVSKINQPSRKTVRKLANLKFKWITITRRL